ncbi:Signal transduction histidine kinase [Streptoalloteichus tenebrarius]|uniref:histidine kinase n=1 Tax=Streptoalloteichus tenebrarius (strain ATCC 17920 / DSM 40477 / JCM 4838 / CBS 697.72 / NBRC 16177 / NCIMB 11028 / NRRL B-12390 / A12253. 1 / ISP 5477) TaxID=1933 RepID=A0ABT1HYH8_STRSD|nr:sensor histidine kinase [Streptoalloteichus tenebrarius]MCP2260582.1 Signal transduction histidine kinase [Streptoalloteichus tenebrarius]BFF01926.1 histidine kinase [Streptoalloteichus tenebrarius]
MIEAVLLAMVVSAPSEGSVLTGFSTDLTWWVVVWGLAAPTAVALLTPFRPLLATPLAAALWCVCVVVRRDHPDVGLLPSVLALVVAAHLAGARSASTRAALLGLGGVALAAAVVVPVLTADSGTWFVTLAGVLLLGVVPWLAGRHRRQYRELVRAGWDRAEQLEREQRIVAEQARLRERARLAGDMHDLLGHELGLAALRIGALELAPDLDERHREAAGAARRAVTSAADRLAEIVGLLRDRAPEPASGEDVAALVERSRDSGVPVSLSITGDGEHVPPLVRRTAHRVVQESVTNAMKHAPGRPVSVAVRHSADETRVTVTNTGPSPASEPPRPGGGYGLVGLAERVRLVGGVFDAGWRGERFEVNAVLPHPAGTRPGPAVDVPRLSESALRLREARQRVRRSFVVSVTTGVLITLGVISVTIGFMVYDASTSVLRPADFARLRVGQPRAEVEPVLPPRTRVDHPTLPEPARPEGAVCRYYGTREDLFDGQVRLFRVCFRDDRLVAKDVLGAPTVGSTSD